MNVCVLSNSQKHVSQPLSSSNVYCYRNILHNLIFLALHLTCTMAFMLCCNIGGYECEFGGIKFDITDGDCQTAKLNSLPNFSSYNMVL